MLQVDAVVPFFNVKQHESSGSSELARIGCKSRYGEDTIPAMRQSVRVSQGRCVIKIKQESCFPLNCPWIRVIEPRAQEWITSAEQ